MEIKKNSRQIPSDSTYTADKGYYDLLYGYLQTISVWEPGTNIRYVPKNQAKFVDFAKKFNLSRQAISRRFKHLMEQGLIILDSENKRYVLPTLDSQVAALLPNSTIRTICNTLKSRTLTVLSYLIKTFIQHGQKPCQVSITYMKQLVGLDIGNTNLNNQIIKDCLLVLKTLGFIRYHIEYKQDHKMIYILDYATNEVEWCKLN